MKVRIAALLLTTLSIGTVAVADDSPSARPNQTHRQLMKQCMAEERAKSSAASAEDMKKTCEERVKSYQDHPSAPTPEKAPSN